jgi:hypothetical protein
VFSTIARPDRSWAFFLIGRMPSTATSKKKVTFSFGREHKP